jgi:hypothetical protein
MAAHKSEYNKHVQRLVCQKCGLVYLKNKRTEKAIKEPCKGSE